VGVGGLTGGRLGSGQGQGNAYTAFSDCITSRVTWEDPASNVAVSARDEKPENVHFAVIRSKFCTQHVGLVQGDHLTEKLS